MITNQRVLRFGYKGFSQAVERELLLNKIEDVKVVKSGFWSLFFDVADVKIHTSNNQIETLRNILDSRKIQHVLSDLLAQIAPKIHSDDKKPTPQDSEWIDDALGQSQGKVFDPDEHRDETIGKIGDVFRGDK